MQKMFFSKGFLNIHICIQSLYVINNKERNMALKFGTSVKSMGGGWYKELPILITIFSAIITYVLWHEYFYLDNE